MTMDYGNMKNPTGNAIIYWKIVGNNSLFKNAEIIASNFVISPLQFDKETLMVNFPPVLIESYEKLLKIAEANNIDLIRGEDIDIPDNVTDFNKFYKKQIEKYNGIIQEYLIAYREKNNLDTSTRTLPQLINLAGEIMESVRKLVKIHGKTELIRIKIDKLKEIQEFLDSEMKGYDLKNIITILDKPDNQIDKLVDLYKRKLVAIFLEDYEKANDLKKEILKLENSIFH